VPGFLLLAHAILNDLFSSPISVSAFMPLNGFFRRFIFILLSLVVAGCAAYATHQYNDRFGEPQVRDRNWVETAELEYHRDIQPIFEQRCTVCHGCYDAPCQLKLDSFAGVDRGASEKQVYNGERLLAANLTRLFIDADNTQQWRDKGFYAVLNEREQSPQANLAGSLLYQMLNLKKRHPLPEQAVLPDSFDFSLSRQQQCSRIEDFDSFQRDYPLWGMPYGLPALADQEFDVIKRWLEQGAKVVSPPPLPASQQQQLVRWEDFFNGQSLKQQLVSRYLYEHLFLADIYFDDAAGQRYKLVRSLTPPGQPIRLIASRRPYDDPQSQQFYYRLQAQYSSVLLKTHMRYVLDQPRLQRWQQLFFTQDYSVTELPSFDPRTAANPFITFKDIPVKSRYQFMLDEAQFTIMGFIKGPVCRGQVALNVIHDHFWVFFVNPELVEFREESQFLADNADYLRLPTEQADTLAPMRNWLQYARLQKHYMQAKEAHLRTMFPHAGAVTLEAIWNGRAPDDERYLNQANPNAGLTVFRHFDSASVEKGLLGEPPKTAWVIGYPLLERIHYLLVAGFDVYGNVGHQLLTRLFMDFLRMEGEFNFVNLLPEQVAAEELQYWYSGAESQVKDYIQSLNSRGRLLAHTDFANDQHKAELFKMLESHLGQAGRSPKTLQAHSSTREQQLSRLLIKRGASLSNFSEYSLMMIEDEDGQQHLYSLLRNRAHKNISGLFGEMKKVIPEQQSFSLTRGVVGSYPNSFFYIPQYRLPDFVDSVLAVADPRDYKSLLDRFGVRRSDRDFWQFSEQLHQRYQQLYPAEYGLLDYNRLENR
jgi:hypothetical protein